VDGLLVTSVTITAPDPRGLADFYARLLDTPVTSEEDGWAQIRSSGLTLNFEYEAQWTAPTWPSVPGKQHATQHLDIRVTDLATATEHAVRTGATLASFQPQEHVRVLLDPAGHPFCLFT
jgi:catechol-2,3-dioxygenase